MNNFNYPYNTNVYYFVNGIEGAKSFAVQPNQTVLLMDSDAPMCYMKQSNGIGQSSIRYFKLTEVKEDDLKKKEADPEIEGLKERITNIENLLKDKKKES